MLRHIHHPALACPLPARPCGADCRAGFCPQGAAGSVLGGVRSVAGRGGSGRGRRPTDAVIKAHDSCMRVIQASTRHQFIGWVLLFEMPRCDTKRSDTPVPLGGYPLVGSNEGGNVRPEQGPSRRTVAWAAWAVLGVLAVSGRTPPHYCCDPSLRAAQAELLRAISAD